MGSAKLNIRGFFRWLRSAAVWCAFIAIVIVFVGEGRARYAAMKVDQVVINIADSTSDGNLINTSTVRRILSNNKVRMVGELSKDVDLLRIEKLISKNGFVERVNAYTNYRNELHIDIYQRSAAARLLIDGYNCYISSDGYLFSAPPTTALYTPVITGSYKPIFPPNFVGSIDEYTSARIEELSLELDRLEREKYPIYQREKLNNEDKRAVRKRYINRSIFEDRDEFDKKVVALREENRKLRELYAYRQRVIDGEIAAINRKQDAVRARQKKLQKNCDDLHNLITFVEMVEDDDFWRSEVVQIIVTEGVDDQIRIGMAVRSADFKVMLGSLLKRSDYLQEPEQHQSETSQTIRAMLPSVTMTKRMREHNARKERKRCEALVKKSIESKLKRLKEFYDEALPRVGWSRYSEINIEFDKQVVCKK